MKRSVNVRFDGKVLQPEEPLDLDLNVVYQITIETAPSRQQAKPPRALSRIRDRAQDLGVSDLADQHDHYLYGLPKR